MADRFTTSYEIGGGIREKDISALVDAALTDGFSLDYGSENSPEELEKNLRECVRQKMPFVISALEIAWGQTEALDEFCREKKLHYLKRVEGKYEYNGALHWWKPGMKSEQEWTETDKDATRVMVSLDRLKSYQKALKPFKAVIRDLNKIAPTPPPIHIKG